MRPFGLVAFHVLRKAEDKQASTMDLHCGLVVEFEPPSVVVILMMVYRSATLITYLASKRSERKCPRTREKLRSRWSS